MDVVVKLEQDPDAESADPQLVHLCEQIDIAESDVKQERLAREKEWEAEDSVLDKLKNEDAAPPPYGLLEECRQLVHRINEDGAAVLSPDTEPHVCLVCSYTCKQIKQMRIHGVLVCHKLEATSVGLVLLKEKSGYPAQHRKNMNGFVSTKTQFMTNTGERRYACHQCSFKTKQLSSFKSHKRIHTGEKPHSCNSCSFKTNVSSSLKKHKKIHSGEKPYSCDSCSFKTKHLSNLKTHKIIHTGEKPYCCDSCSFKTKRSDTLIRHKMIHSDEKPYSCDSCSFKSREMGNLIRHKRIHSGEKPHCCDICSFKTNDSSSLKRHKKIHSGEKPYSCTVVASKQMIQVV